MKELTMSISTKKDGGENKVVLTAAFATHEEAVKFHDGLSSLARQHSDDGGGGTGIRPRLLGFSKS